MTDINNKIREIAARLLKDKQVDLFMAWEKGELDYQVKPYFARTPEEADRMVFNDYCIQNLSNGLLKFRDGQEKIGIVVKGCDSRGIVRLLEDNQITRERLYIVGVCCPGMKDPLKAALNDSGFKKQSKDVPLADKCLKCRQPNPVIYDEILGQERVPDVAGERFSLVRDLENKTPDERYAFFEDILSRCIRCYACRQVCVACNCRTCIFDDT
ncbi:MAG: 4Fe-4S ferredoxin, partial [Syntrophomonadaceae bacterium]|nr:4Fe-4S ferredoxin [Syntrophomonadaceae bacterium]